MLKWIAVLFMLIDHIAYYFYPHMPNDLYTIMRIIGRLAFPIFAYGIVLGAERTRSIVKYFLRLIIFAIAGQLVIEAAAYSVGQRTFVNTIFTLAFGLMLIVGVDFMTQSMQGVVMTLRPLTAGNGRQKASTPSFNVRVNLKKYTMPAWQGILTGGFLVILSITLVIILKPDYELFGLSVMLLFYILEKRLEPYSPTQSAELKQKRLRYFFVSFAILNLLNAALKSMANPYILDWSLVQIFSTFSVFFFQVDAKNTNKPKAWEKYFFYFFYPIHIAILILLSAKF